MKLYKITYKKSYARWTNLGRNDSHTETLSEFITTDNIIDFMSEFQKGVIKKRKEFGDEIEEEIKKEITDILFIDSI